MIAETSFLGTSPWQADTFLSKELFKLSTDQEIETGELSSWTGSYTYSTLEHNFDKKPWGETLQHLSNEDGISHCSDDFYVDVENDFQMQDHSDKEYIEPPILDILGESPDIDNVANYDWVEADYEIEETAEEYIPYDNASETMSNGKICLEDSKSWSSMTQKEKTMTIQELSRLVSQEMGLREQLEVIRIINSHAHISPTDTEFVIEMEYLNDVKLQEIKRLLLLHQVDITCSSDEDSSIQGVPEYTNERESSQERKIQQRLEKQRLQKERKQAMKEKRSGLFAQEEVLALTVCDPGDAGDDIDIC